MLTEGEAGEGEKTKQESSPTQANKSLREQAKFKVQRQRQTTTNVQKSTRSKTGKKAGTRYNDEPAKNEGETHLNTLGRAG